MKELKWTGIALLASLWALPPNFAAAQPSEGPDFSKGPVRLDDLVAEVRRSNPETLAAARRFDAAAEMEKREGAFEDPMVRVSYGARPDMMKGVGFTVEQKIPFWGVRGLKADAARAGAQAMLGESRMRELDAVALMQRSFHEWLLYRRAREINVTIRGFLDQVLSIASQRYRAGLAPQSDALRAAAELSRLGVMDQEFLRMQEGARARINLLLGREPGSPLGDPEEMHFVAEAEPAEDSLLDRALENRPELAAARSRLRERAAGEALSSRAYWPDFTVGGSYRPKKLASSAAGMGQYDDMVEVMVGFSLPLQFGAKRAAAREAAFGREAAQFDLEAAGKRVLFEVHDQYLVLRQSRRNFELYRDEIVPATKLAMDATRRSYENDRAGFAELLDAERSYQDVLFEESKALHTYHFALVDLERATGAPLAHHHGQASGAREELP